MKNNKIQKLRFFPVSIILSLLFLLNYIIISNNNVLLAHSQNDESVSKSLASFHKDTLNLSDQQKLELLRHILDNNKSNLNGEPDPDLEKQTCFTALDQLSGVNECFYEDPSDIKELNDMSQAFKNIIESKIKANQSYSVTNPNLKEAILNNQLLSICSRYIFEAAAELILSYDWGMFYKFVTQAPGILAWNISIFSPTR
ncbi:hypothetical protein H7686_0001460 [Candidatus Phytoplasma asiaticum]|uniref:Effector n=1 Tax=Candidatus Phytoplasma asiaticum TaxID=2763338 RepID=A0AAX3B8L6_9MOLU|nr:hypothetical protein ['Parthenium hysterophorus' phyllody phytoplasma]UQV27017.1 hypothetical protein H7686_0001460 ['Parthenium hysterophorus' phyllody phytoplasma]